MLSNTNVVGTDEAGVWGGKSSFVPASTLAFGFYLGRSTEVLKSVEKKSSENQDDFTESLVEQFRFFNSVIKGINSRSFTFSEDEVAEEGFKEEKGYKENYGSFDDSTETDFGFSEFVAAGSAKKVLSELEEHARAEIEKVERNAKLLYEDEGLEELAGKGYVESDGSDGDEIDGDEIDGDEVDGVLTDLIATGCKAFKKAKKLLSQDAKGLVHGFVGNRAFGRNGQPLQNMASVPAQFIFGGDLKLDTYPFVVEGTKNDINDYFESEKERSFVINKGCELFVNIRACMELVEVTDLVQQGLARIFMPAIGEISREVFSQLLTSPEFVGFFTDLMAKIADGERPDFSELSEVLDGIPDFDIGAIGEAMEGVETVGETMEMAEDAGETAKSYMEKFAKAVLETLDSTNVSEVLSFHQFKHVSGPMHLCSDVKSGKRMQIEFDCKGSSRSQACLQISSGKQRFDFAGLHNMFKSLS